MRINDDEGKSLSSVYLGLTDDETEQLIGVLSSLRTAKKGWHEHVTNSTCEREVTVYREDDETAVSRDE